MENYVGKRLDGRYEIMEIIGVGGMAVVYKAFDNIDHRIVAIKILKQEYLTNEEFKRRFRNESKAIAVLSHPNIVKVFDVSFGDIIQYIVMEYVEGISLKEYIQQQGIVDTREAIYFTTQILRALSHAHSKGIVHRDVKPQNIMLTSNGTIKVTDFGIARFSQNETRTMTDGAIGSVHYISPEQAKGSVTDAKTDIYSAGVMLYEMLTGTLPFQSDNAVSVALMQLQNDPKNPREINPNISVGLEEIIIRAMQKNQNMRYQSAEEMLDDIIKFKNNPAIIFGYSYEPLGAQQTENDFIENTPINDVAESSNVDPVNDDEYSDEEAEFDAKGKNKTIAILTSVLLALLICGIALAVTFLPSKSSIDVPELIGLNFYTDVMNKAEYANFEFEPVIDEESTEESGTILDQSPSGGKVEIGSVITIYISGEDTKVAVPDVYGYESASASTVLKGKGFDVKIEKEVSEQELGTVVRTSPAKGEMASVGSVVTIYVSSLAETGPVDVPDLLGLTIAQAKEALEEVGLTLDAENTEYRSSTEPAGRIIGYEHIGEQVESGTSIAVYVSTGRETTTTEETTEDETTEEDTTESTTESTTKETTTKPTTTKPTTTKPTTTKPTTTKPTTTQSTTRRETTEPTTQSTTASTTATTTTTTTQADTTQAVATQATETPSSEAAAE